MALKRWDGTFRLAAMMMPISESVGMDIVMDEFAPARTSDTEEAGRVSDGGVSPSGSHGTGEPAVVENAKGNFSEGQAPSTGEQWGAWTRWVVIHENVDGVSYPRGYGLSWKWQSLEEAAVAAMRACRKGAPAMPFWARCGENYLFFSTSFEHPPTEQIVDASMIARRQLEKFSGGVTGVQCLIVTWTDDKHGYIHQFYLGIFDTHTEAETIQALKRYQLLEDSWRSLQVSKVVCNDR